MFWYIAIPVIILLLIIIFIIWSYYKVKDKSIFTLGLVLFIVISLLSWILSSSLYKFNHPDNIYKLEVLSTSYDPSRYNKPAVFIQYDNKILPVRFDNPEDWKNVNVGDTIIARGYDEHYLEFYKYYDPRNR